MKFTNLSFQNMLRLLLVCWAIMQLLCYPLWHGLRDYPLVPVWNQLLQLPWYLHDVLFYTGLGIMLLLLFKPNKKIAAFLLLVLLLSAVLDQNRWQPWHYQFIWMLSAFVFLQKEKQVQLAWQIIVVAVYFYSGLSKLQPYFIHDVWKFSMLQSWLGIYSNNEWVWRAGYLIPLAEMFFAMLLLMKRFRKVGVGALLCMHLFILLWLGPTGLHFNTTIWPWNLVMPVFLIGLFYQQAVQRQPIFIKSFFVKTMLLACCVLPLLGRWGYWDRYLSFQMYTGDVPHLYICTNNRPVLMEYAKYMGNRSSSLFPCKFPIPVYQWAYMSMHTPPNNEKRILASVAEQWKKQHPGVDASFHLYKAGFSPTLLPFDVK